MDTRKRFRVLTDALGVDGDKLLEEFMQGYIDRIRRAVPRAMDDEGEVPDELETSLAAVNS